MSIELWFEMYVYIVYIFPISHSIIEAAAVAEAGTAEQCSY